MKLDQISANDNPDNRRKVAIERCNDQIQWYEKHASRTSFLYRLFQTCAIVFGGLTPILILWGEVPKPIQALPAALAAVSAGLVGIFQWQQDWARFSDTAEALKSELIKYETRTSAEYAAVLENAVALDNFVQRIETLALTETRSWHSQQFQPIPNRTTA